MAALSLSLVATLCQTVGTAAASAQSGPAPKAVFIVGPTGDLTDDNLADAETMARQAEAVGMDVRRVFFPNATWDNVLANVQGASFVVYMGHGYGWPSHYTRQMTESRQNGMGLNSFAGSGRNTYRYYGAKPIRENIRLAPNAVVLLNHLCYASGNGEAGMAIPSEEIARRRVDNMANGWIGAGARAVFAFTWTQKLDFPRALMTTDSTMDEMFMTRSNGSPSGFVGWRNVRYDSDRTPGAVNHLDPDRKRGYLRALTGDLNMNAAEFRSGIAASSSPTPPPPEDSADAPRITSLTAGSSTSPPAINASVARFHPNGDGLDDELVLTHTLTRAAYLDVWVADAAGAAVRMFSARSPGGISTSRWDGRDDAGVYVRDGTYTLTHVPRDAAGVVGEPVSIEAQVLTAVKLGTPSSSAFYASDHDRLARRTRLAITVNQAAEIAWLIVDGSGVAVRTVRAKSDVGPGTIGFTWDGRADDGSWVPDGWYASRVVASTELGTYSQERTVYVGAYRLVPSIGSPARGTRITLTILSSEPLSGRPTLRVSQPGGEPWTVTARKVNRKKFKATITLRSGGDPGEVQFRVSGSDRYGGSNVGSFTLPLR